MQPYRYLHKRSAQAMTNVELNFITKDDVTEIAADHPFLLERINELSAKRLAKDQLKINVILKKTADSLGVAEDSTEMKAVLEHATKI